ncbi:YuzF family protein [Paenibacillus doosanensis]|uniref:YuzF family protein n=1 Tax=Paenibacillus doosanensis TaxID=1229154 RepID=UPI00217F9834|nr:YuzF family protein [Paenibacillus doosanensis]MCS7461433.1 YuzF family protein [Paenibacillus doosanensis]
MNRFVYYGNPQPYASYPVPQYSRNEVLQRKETLVLPKNIVYTTAVEPKFTEHLIRHKGLKVVITTTVGKLVGTLDDVFIDHVALTVNQKMHHIRLGEIVYFEKADEK